MKNKIFTFFLVTMLLISSAPVQAQSSDLPVYIVQPGDTLYTIAQQFNISMDDILAVNSIANADWLSEGDQIKIPGYEGISGQFIPYTVAITDTFESIILEHSVDPVSLIKINHLTSPNEILAGKDIILPVLVTTATNDETTGEPSDSLTQPVENSDSSLVSLLQTDQAFWPSDINQLATKILANNNSPIMDLNIDPYPIQQGFTSVIRFTTTPGQKFQFLIDNTVLPVFEYASGSYISFYSINALAQVGLKDAILQNISENGTSVSFSQNLLANETQYSTDPVIIVEPELIDPVNTLPEEEELFALGSIITDRDLWDGSFSYPVDDACIRSPYGSIRSYNNGPYDTFHTGIDFGTCASNLNIYAAGSGRVVFAGSWFVRGNSVVIDHGWGIFTGYWHQESIAVKVGDIVEEGQIIGTIGSTGRSTGAHLHLEMLVNDVQVDPMQWMELTIP
jgi:murein DD-endopeptidase MepM/ murein hydrolase activator NlpD